MIEILNAQITHACFFFFFFLSDHISGIPKKVIFDKDLEEIVH